MLGFYHTFGSLRTYASKLSRLPHDDWNCVTIHRVVALFCEIVRTLQLALLTAMQFFAH